jgi:hypothetical protein
VTAGQPVPGKIPGERTREDGLDKPGPRVAEFAPIGSREGYGQTFNAPACLPAACHTGDDKHLGDEPVGYARDAHGSREMGPHIGAGHLACVGRSGR